MDEKQQKIIIEESEKHMVEMFSILSEEEKLFVVQALKLFRAIDKYGHALKIGDYKQIELLKRILENAEKALVKARIKTGEEHILDK